MTNNQEKAVAEFRQGLETRFSLATDESKSTDYYVQCPTLRFALTPVSFQGIGNSIYQANPLTGYTRGELITLYLEAIVSAIDFVPLSVISTLPIPREIAADHILSQIYNRGSVVGLSIRANIH